RLVLALAALAVLAVLAPAVLVTVLVLSSRGTVPGSAVRHRRTSPGHGGARPLCGVRRTGTRPGTVLIHAHAAGGSGDSRYRGGQADGYVQAAHGATSVWSTGSTSPTPATRKKTRVWLTRNRARAAGR